MHMCDLCRHLLFHSSTVRLSLNPSAHCHQDQPTNSNPRESAGLSSAARDSGFRKESPISERSHDAAEDWLFSTLWEHFTAITMVLMLLLALEAELTAQHQKRGN